VLVLDEFQILYIVIEVVMQLRLEYGLGWRCKMSTSKKLEDDRIIENPTESPAESSIECPTCNGTGIIYPPPQLGLNIIGGITCPRCIGIGII
jgi:DnaJ-class molecular chaperone